MKKSVVMILILLTIVLCSSAVVVMMATGIITKGSEDTDDSLIVEADNSDVNDYIRFQIWSGEVEIGENLTGTVVMLQEEKKNYTIEKINDNFKLNVNVGDYVNIGEVLYTDNNGKEILAENNLRVTSIVKNSTFFMEVFLYDGSGIMVSIPEKYQNKLDSMEFTTLNEEGEPISLELLSIDTTVAVGKVNLILKNEFDLFEASTVDVKAIYEVVSNKISIPKEFVFFDSYGQAYVHIIEENNVYDQNIDIFAETNDTYIINNELDGYTIGYKLEEKFMTN